MKHSRIPSGYSRPRASWKSSAIKRYGRSYTKVGGTAKQVGRPGGHDHFYTALAPGWRFKRVGSRMIHWYYENRANRSDRPGSKV